MARARNIKPGFFTNEELVELPFHTRLLFVGLWTLCDRAGRMEDRPKRIKMALFPADDIDVDESLDALQKSGFLMRYEHGGERYIQVIAFEKHQNPHRDERASTIPAPCEHGANLAESLFSDSPIPETGNPISAGKPAKSAEDPPPEFMAAWQAYPRRSGASRKDALKAWRARVKAGADPAAILAGVQRYAAYCTAMKTDERYIKQPETFFGPGDHYLADWTAPPSAKPRVHHDLSGMDYTAGIDADGRF